MAKTAAKCVVVAKLAWKLHQARCPSTAWWHYEAEVYIFMGCIMSLHVKFMILYTQLQTCYFSLEISANVISLHNLIQMKIWAWGLLFFKNPKKVKLLQTRCRCFQRKHYSFAFAEIFLLQRRQLSCVLHDISTPCANSSFLRWYTHIITTI